MSSLRKQVGDLVRHHRERKRLTQSQLAERTSRSVEMIGRIERGSAAPSFETLEAFSRALDTPVRDFFGLAEHAASGSAEDALARLIGRASGLDDPDLEWLDRLVAVALSRKLQR